MSLHVLNSAEREILTGEPVQVVLDRLCTWLVRYGKLTFRGGDARVVVYAARLLHSMQVATVCEYMQNDQWCVSVRPQAGSTWCPNWHVEWSYPVAVGG